MLEYRPPTNDDVESGGLDSMSPVGSHADEHSRSRSRGRSPLAHVGSAQIDQYQKKNSFAGRKLSLDEERKKRREQREEERRNSSRREHGSPGMANVTGGEHSI